MSEHNTFTAEPGKIVIYGEWTGSAYVEHQAYIRAIVEQPGGVDEPTIHLRYSTGGGAAQNVNNVLNIEHITGNVDYWRAQYDPVIGASLPPSITRPVQGAVVWLTIWDNSIQDDYRALAFVRAIPGDPSDQTPNLNLSYYDVPSETDVNINVVAPFAGSSGDDYWFDQR